MINLTISFKGPLHMTDYALVISMLVFHFFFFFSPVLCPRFQLQKYLHRCFNYILIPYNLTLSDAYDEVGRLNTISYTLLHLHTNTSPLHDFSSAPSICRPLTAVSLISPSMLICMYRIVPMYTRLSQCTLIWAVDRGAHCE